jgi:hypothetical protein
VRCLPHHTCATTSNGSLLTALSDLQAPILNAPAVIGAVVMLRQTRQYVDPPSTTGSFFFVSLYDLCTDSVQVRL